MQTYDVVLESPVSKTFRCQRAADSLDIDVKKKSIHKLSIKADLDSDYSIGLIVGSSGSGKTTLAKSIFGQDCFKTILDDSKTIIDQLPEELNYDQCSEILNGIGLTQVPCWIRPAVTLSNGQRARAEAALLMTSKDETIIIDEWTSVVDRTVAKAMSHCVQKFARRSKKKVILVSCHYDVIDWIDPDWIIDCNKSLFIDRRSLPKSERERKEKLDFTIRKVDRSTWAYFSKYHYLSEKLPGGAIECFGLFHGNDQIGFQCFANYVPKVKSARMIMHSNRTVIHPDYCGLGLGVKLINETSKYMASLDKYKIMAKFSSTPVYKAFMKHPEMWKLCSVNRQIGKMKVGRVRKMGRSSGTGNGGFRINVKTYSFEFIG